MVVDDGKRPGRVRRFEAMPQLRKGARLGYSAATATPEVAPGADFLATTSIVLAFGGMATRIKACAWVALFACLSSGANWRRPDGDARAIVGAFMYVCGVYIVLHSWMARARACVCVELMG